MVRDGVKSSLPLVAARSFRVFSRARLQQASGRPVGVYVLRLAAEGGETMLVGEEVPELGHLLTAAVRRGCCPARQDLRAHMRVETGRPDCRAASPRPSVDSRQR